MSNVSVQPATSGSTPPSPPHPRRGGCAVASIVVLVILLSISVVANVGLLAKQAGSELMRRPERLSRTWVSGSGDARVTLIEIEGVIADEVRSPKFFGATVRPVERLRRELDEAAQDPSVKGVILAVNSPGGTVTASDEIHHLLAQFHEKTKKKVVVHMGALCASGGYYASAGADVIIASPTTITGSIGVIFQTFNVSKPMEQTLKIENVTIESGSNKDLLNPFQPLEKEHVRIVQGIVDQAYDRFITVVAAGRRLAKDEVRRLADGRIYTADEALALKLVDKIGYMSDAVEEAKRLAGVPDVTVFRYTRPPSIFDAITGQVEARAPAGDAADVIASLISRAPRLCYLWSPGLVEMTRSE